MNNTTNRNNLKKAIAEELENTLDYDAWFFDGHEDAERYDYERSMIYAAFLAMDELTDIQIDQFLAIDDEEKASFLDDLFFSSDTVTGNASGSFFCNAWKAEAALAHNWDLIEETQNEFGPLELSRGPEYIDVCIRCYLACSVCQTVAERIIDRMDAIEDEQNELNTQEELNDVLTASKQESTIGA